MTKSFYTKAVYVLLFLNLVWCSGLAIVGDFYPHLETIRLILAWKAGVNGVLSTIALITYPAMVEDLDRRSAR